LKGIHGANNAVIAQEAMKEILKDNEIPEALKTFYRNSEPSAIITRVSRKASEGLVLFFFL